jgi:hypothetical protein
VIDRFPGFAKHIDCGDDPPPPIDLEVGEATEGRGSRNHYVNHDNDGDLGLESSQAVITAQGNQERGGKVAGANEKMCGVLLYVGLARKRTSE